MQPNFTDQDVAEVRQLNRKLNRLPRLRMKTTLGRVVLNVLLRIVEIYPMLRSLRSGDRPELETIERLGKRVKVRIFKPRHPCRGVILDCHGGGWTIGNARMADTQNAALAARLGVTVISVDYRLALSNPLAMLIDDCEAVMMWTFAQAESKLGSLRIIVKGSSAGAHLAAATLLRLRDRDNAIGRIDGAVLLFGLYDFSGTAMVRNAGPETLILHGPTVRATLCKLTPGLTDAERKSPAISPAYADLTGLPPALFIVGTEDILLEDSQRMEARWRIANENSELLIAPDSSHAFNHMGTSVARKIEQYMDDWILARFTQDR